MPKEAISICEMVPVLQDSRTVPSIPGFGVCPQNAGPATGGAVLSTAAAPAVHQHDAATASHHMWNEVERREQRWMRGPHIAMALQAAV